MFHELVCKNLENYRDFEFMQPERIADNEIELNLTGTTPANIEVPWVPQYHFTITELISKHSVGWIEFRVCLTEPLTKFGGNIGYEIYEPFRGHNYAAKGFKLLFGFIRSHQLNTILITCGEQNIPSRRTCEKIGAELVKIESTLTDKNIMRPTCYYILNLSKSPETITPRPCMDSL